MLGVLLADDDDDDDDDAEGIAAATSIGDGVPFNPLEKLAADDDDDDGGHGRMREVVGNLATGQGDCDGRSWG